AAPRVVHEGALERVGVPAAALEPLGSYLELLERWSRRVNLTGARSAERRVALLIEPALALQQWLLPGALVDVGSGNGSPGLVLGLLDRVGRVTLLEARARRWAFLREVTRTCRREDIDVRRERHQRYPGPPAPNVTARGLRLRPSELARLVAPGG